MRDRESAEQDGQWGKIREFEAELIAEFIESMNENE